MKKTFIFSFCLVFLSLLVHGQTLVIPKMDVGSSEVFQVKKLKQEFNDGTLIAHEELNYEATLLLVDEKAEVLEWSWTFDVNLSEQFNVAEEDLDRFGAVKTMSVPFSTKKDGTYLGINDWEAVANRIDKIYALKMDTEKDPRLSDKSVRLEVLKNLSASYDSSMKIEKGFLSEIRHLFYPCGVEFQEKKNISYIEKLPNTMAEAPLRGRVNIQMTPKGEDIEFIHEMGLLKEDAQYLLAAIMEQQKLSGEQTYQLASNSRYDIADYNQYVFGKHSGLLKTADIRRMVELNLGEQRGKTIQVLQLKQL